jgi:histidine triad (HIT) family protein
MTRQVAGWGKNPATASNDQESSTMTTYAPNNIFSRILRGELPCHRVFENEHCLAFMDIMPRSPGHTLVIPRSPARTILDIEPAALSALAVTVQTVARAVKTAMVADGLTIQQFNESAGGQVVFLLEDRAKVEQMRAAIGLFPLKAYLQIFEQQAKTKVGFMETVRFAD